MRTFLYVFISIILATSSRAAKKRVCIIGAGLSGLVAARYISEYPNEFEPVVFEKNSDVGGLWIFTNSTTIDEHGLPVHSSIYKNLITNAVKEMMTFPDYPDFGGESGKANFVKHEDVLQYLGNYTDHFNLRQYIKFNTNVEKVRPLPKLKWLFRSQNLDAKQRSYISCDAAIICNGFNVKGYLPKIPGIASFTGQTLHSHVYREPESFANQIIVVLGASFSAIDISIDITSVAKKVYLSHRRDKLPDVFPPNLEQVPGVVAAESGELILSNGTRIRADTLLYCTGYVYDFPFLDKNSGIVVEDGKYIRSIYKHMINIHRPTMAIINVPEPGYHFKNPHAQMQYFRATFLGKLGLPNREQMSMDARLPASVPKNKAHYVPGDDIVKYHDELAVMAGGEPLPWWFAPVRQLLDQIIINDPMQYKTKRLVINEDDRSVEFV